MTTDTDKKHLSHKTRSSDASTFDEICMVCGVTDTAGQGWGELAKPCQDTDAFNKDPTNMQDRILESEAKESLEKQSLTDADIYALARGCRVMSKDGARDATKVEIELAQQIESLSAELTELREYIEKIAKAIGLDMRFWKEKGPVEIAVCISDLLKAAKENSAELTELRQAKESLDWLIKHNAELCWPLSVLSYRIKLNDLDDVLIQTLPPYLKSRLEGKK